MNDFDWKLIDTLQEYKSISKASEKLYIAQSTVSKKLKNIEDELGVTIAVRTQKGLVFTPYGEYIAAQSKFMIQKISEIKSTIKHIDKTIAGTIRIACSYFLFRYIVSDMIKQFKRIYPEVVFDIIATTSDTIVPMLNDKIIDIGFMRGDSSWSDNSVLLDIGKLSIVSCNPISMKDLHKHDMIAYKPNFSQKTLLDNWWNDHFSTPPKVTLIVDSSDFCKEMILAEQGFGIIPHKLIEDIKSRQLYIIDLKDKDGKELSRRSYMHYSGTALFTPSIKAFVNYVKSNI